LKDRKLSREHRSDNTDVFCIASLEEMGELGKLFGGEVLCDSVYDKENSKPVVVSLYGISHTGKTEFSLAVLDGTRKGGYYLLPSLVDASSYGRRKGAHMSVVDGNIFLHKDFKCEFIDKIKDASAFQQEDLISVKDNFGYYDEISVCHEDRNGLILLEHPSAIHLGRSDVAILMSIPFEHETAEEYIASFKYMVNEYMPQSAWKSQLLSGVTDFICETMKGDLKSRDTIVKIIVNPDRKSLVEKMQKFKDKASHLSL